MLSLLQKRGANLLNPESVFKAIDHAKKFDWAEKRLTEQELSEGTKKGGSPRQFKVSQKLVAMLNSLPKVSHRVWGNAQLDHFRKKLYVPEEADCKQAEEPAHQQNNLSHA